MHTRPGRSPLLTIAGLAVATAAALPLQAGTRVSDFGDGVRHHEWTNLLSSTELRTRGEIEFTADDRAVERISPGGFLTLRTRDGFRRRAVHIEPAADGALTHEYRVGGRRREFDAEARAWLAAELPRIIRETGVGAGPRVARLLDAGGVPAVLGEIERIESGTALRLYGLALIERTELAPRQLRRLATAMRRGIGSSGEKAAFLLTARDAFLESGAHEAFFETATSVRSSGDRARVLLDALDHPSVDEPGPMAALLRSAQEIPSSGDKARVLVRAVDRFPGHDETRRAFFDAVASVASSGDRARVLLALIDRGGLDGESAVLLCRTARGIASSGDRARVLIALTPSYDPASAAARRACFDAVVSIPSSGDRARTLHAFLDRAELDRAGLLALLSAARSIPSSGDKTSVLVRAARAAAADDELRAAYLDVVATIPSAGDRERARAAVVR